MNDSPRKNRRLAISLRGLLLLVLIVGLLLGWRIQRARDQKRVVQALREAHVYVWYDWQYVGGTYRTDLKPPGPQWLRRRLGDEYFQEVTRVFIEDTDPYKLFCIKPIVPPGEEAKAALKLDRLLESLRYLDHLREVDIDGPQLSDPSLSRIRDLPALETLILYRTANLTGAGFVNLRGLDNLKTLGIHLGIYADDSVDRIAEISSLEELDLTMNRITDVHLDRLARLPRLRFLSLGSGGSEISVDGMVMLRGLKSLQFINIEHAKVGNAGLMALVDLPKLREVWAYDTWVTPEGIKQFQSRRPDVQVHTTLCRLTTPLRLQYP